MEQKDIIRDIRDAGVGNTVDPELLERFPVSGAEEKMVPTRDGETHIFVYTPADVPEPFGLFVNAHGGGFVKGHRQQDIVFSRNVCHHVGCMVIDIDYTPAPEQKYPYAIHQCYDVVKWAWDNAEELGVDRNRIAMGGHSAGGNCTAAVSILAGQSGDFKLQLQVMDYPALDLHTPPELKRCAYTNKSLPPSRMRLYNSVYIDDSQVLEPTASPVHAPMEMLYGLPEALILTCEKDCLCDEAERYAMRLIQAGVAVTARRFLHSRHGFVVRRADEYEQAERMIFTALRRVLR